MTNRAPKGRGRFPTGVVAARGRFRYWIYVDGERIYSRTFDSIREAAAARAEHLRLRRAAPAGMTITAGIDAVRVRNAENGRAAGTVASYEDRFAALLGYFDPRRLLVSIREEDVREFVAHRRRGARTSHATIRKDLQALGRVFRVARLPNPVEGMDLPRVRRSVPRVMSRDDWRSWRSAMLAWTPRRRGRVEDLERDRMVPLLLFGLGLRRSELARLRVRDVNHRRREVRVTGKIDDRLVPVSREIGEALSSWIQNRRLEPEDSICGLSATGVSQVFQRWNRRLGTNWTPHACRHGFGTALAEEGVPVQVIGDLMGHARGSVVTLRYLHSTDKRRREAIDRVFGGS